MKFETYLDQAWNDHGTQTQQVADGFSMGASLISSPDQIAQLAALVTHVMGEHLGQWETGETFLKSLKSHPNYAADTESERALDRSVQILRLAGGSPSGLNAFNGSDQIRICAVAASALAGRSVERAQELLNRALSQAQDLAKDDPAARALAVTGNNLSCALEEKSNRSPGETKLMIHAAHTGRKYWEIAGGSSQVASAEYRLAMAYLAAGDSEKAFQHARNGIELTASIQAPPNEMFSSYEALALAERARGNMPGFKVAAGKAKEYFAMLNDSDKSYYEPILKKLAVT